MQVGIGDTFVFNKEHWVVTDVKQDKFVCRNKDTGAVVEFEKNIVKPLVK